MTNPDNAVGTNAAYGGRTSVNAFNDVLGAYARGIISGWACTPDSGLTVSLGGSGNVRDVAVAEDNAGNKTSINNISGAPVDVTISAAPGTNSRIDAIVAYVDNPPQGTSTIADNYEACGLIAVDGVAAADPVAPSDGAIRSAITADGASGTTAYYVVLAYVTIASGTTDITSDMIAPGSRSSMDLLYTGPSGTTGSISLNSTTANYGSIIVEFRRGTTSGSRRCQVIAEPDGKTQSLVTSWTGSVFTIGGCTITISGSSISFGNGNAVAFGSGGQTGFTSVNELVILNVWGLK